MKAIADAVAVCLITLLLGAAGCQFIPNYAGGIEQDGAADSSQQNALIIENESQLPDTYPGARYEARLFARGGVPPLHWRLEKGALPPGIQLEDTGLLHGAAERTGEFQFTASVTDSGKPQQAVQKQFVVRVLSAMTLVW